MRMVLIDLTETYKVLDCIKSPDARVEAAKAKTLECILRTIEGIGMAKFEPFDPPSKG